MTQTPQSLVLEEMKINSNASEASSIKSIKSQACTTTYKYKTDLTIFNYRSYYRFIDIFFDVENERRVRYVFIFL